MAAVTSGLRPAGGGALRSGAGGRPPKRLASAGGARGPVRPGERTRLRDAVEALNGYPPWVFEGDRAPVRRLLDGERDRVVNGIEIAGFRGLGDRWVTSIVPEDLQRLRDQIAFSVGLARVARARETERRLRSSRPQDYGHGAANNFADRARAIFARIPRPAGTVNPAGSLQNLRVPSNRRPLEDVEIGALHCWIDLARRDPALDHLLLELLLRTGSRLDGLLTLPAKALDVAHCTVLTMQKYHREHERPVQRSLVRAIAELGRARGAQTPDDLILRRPGGRPITDRYVQYLFSEAQQAPVWAHYLPVSAHWLRHTCIDRIRLASDPYIAAAWAGHVLDRRETTYRYCATPGPADLRRVSEATFGVLDDEPLGHRGRPDPSFTGMGRVSR